MAQQIPQVGEWYVMQYGNFNLLFYVLDVTNENVTLGTPIWLVSSAITISLDHFQIAAYIGKGKRRWWWKYMPWKDLHMPFTWPKSFFRL